MSTIHVMDPALVAQIKAGEVIERPASVVRELIENSLDAKATRIRVEIAEGGCDLIRIVDDGSGIEAEELPIAFREHTSSKLRSSEQLECIETLGFRGEALHAIASVSQVEAISGRAGEKLAGRILVDHGQLLETEPAAIGGGTRITVRELFAHVPARRKHLRSARSEGTAVHQVVGGYSLAHPCVAFTLVANGKTILASPGTGELRDAFAAIYGLDIAERMLPVSHAGSVEITGLTSPPSLTRPTRTGIMLFVNGRPIRSPGLVFALEDAYSGLLLVGRHPLAVLRIGVPASDVDSNVHPAKLEIRFLGERQVFAAVRRSVTESVCDVEPVREATQGFGEPVTLQEPDRWLPPPERIPYPEQVSFVDPSPSAGPPPPSVASYPADLRVLAQSSQSFIIAEGTHGLYMIDQHAAHERIIFDRLTADSSPPPVQPLLQPIHVELSPEQWSVYEASQEEVARTGFGVEPLEELSCIVRAVPVAGRGPVVAETLTAVLDEIEAARSPHDRLQQALRVVACHAAVRAGEDLTLEEMQALVSQLASTPNPRSCPHGRPTTIHISTERLEREFARR